MSDTMMDVDSPLPDYDKMTPEQREVADREAKIRQDEEQAGMHLLYSGLLCLNSCLICSASLYLVPRTRRNRRHNPSSTGNSRQRPYRCNWEEEAQRRTEEYRAYHVRRAV